MRQNIFATSEREKLRQNTGILYILTWKYASRHSGVQFFKIWTSKSGRDRQFFNILNWKCASRHSGVQFFDIVTSKSGPKLRCFVHFDFKMCVSPQRRAIFPHLNFKKCSEPLSFLAFSLENVLLATAACNFSTSELQKVVWECSVLYIFTWKCASRHSGVQILDISTSKSGLRPWVF